MRNGSSKLQQYRKIIALVVVEYFIIEIIYMPRIYFDIGANDGHSLIHLAMNSDNIVYAFEPTPRMINIIKQKTGGFKNYHIVPKAISNYNGKSKFYVSGNADWGCSSLCQFNDNLETNWPGRTDFRVTEEIDVDVIRLEDFIIENNITDVEHLHCDVQGHDLEVLMGLGDKLSIVKNGVIEMPTSHEKKLYKDQKYLHTDAIEYLQKNGFEVTKVESNDQFNIEMNVYFTNKRFM